MVPLQIVSESFDCSEHLEFEYAPFPPVLDEPLNCGDYDSLEDADEDYLYYYANPENLDKVSTLLGTDADGDSVVCPWKQWG